MNDDPQDLVINGKNWNNLSNNQFYENLSIEEFKSFADRKAGLATGCDMDILKPYWSEATSILEVGAGYGRVIDYLLDNDFKGKITAIERCNNLFNYLKKNIMLPIILH